MNLDWPSPDDRIGDVYASYAPIYDALFEHALGDTDFYVRAAQARVPAGGSILELGVGTGRLTEHYLRAGFRVVGVDTSADMLERARERLAPHGERCRLVHGDMRSLALGERFAMAVAPFGTVAHLLADDDRRRAFAAVHAHLAPGGVFVFDDCPAWIAGAAGGTTLDLRCTGRDPATGARVRLQTNLFDAAGAPLSVRYDFIDWLDAHDRVSRRVVVRVVFRNVGLDEELALLAGAGFGRVDVHGDFAGTPLDRERPASNGRLVAWCHRGDD
ncbi:MAG: class I SAM-dependent methyltransferase [Gemmatimonadota bacterium]|nr:class I SAM-dependent methyltransferase [Gemmatimonadota bacterium]